MHFVYTYIYMYLRTLVLYHVPFAFGNEHPLVHPKRLDAMASEECPFRDSGRHASYRHPVRKSPLLVAYRITVGPSPSVEIDRRYWD